MNLLKQDVSTVRRKLAEAEAAIPPLERELDEASLDAITSGDMTAATTMLAEQLRIAHERVGIAERAVEAAERIEAAQLAEARQKEARARVRALKAHLANVSRAATEYETAVATTVRAWKSLRAATGQARALLDPANAALLGDVNLLHMAEVEILRQGWTHTTIGDVPDAPGASAGQAWLQGRVPCELAPISEEIAKIAARLVNPPAETSSPASPVSNLSQKLTPGTEDWCAAMVRRQNEAAANG